MSAQKYKSVGLLVDASPKAGMDVVCLAVAKNEQLLHFVHVKLQTDCHQGLGAYHIHRREGYGLDASKVVRPSRSNG